MRDQNRFIWFKMLLKVGGDRELNQHLYHHSLTCGGFGPATTPRWEYSPVMDSNGMW